MKKKSHISDSGHIRYRNRMIVVKQITKWAIQSKWVHYQQQLQTFFIHNHNMIDIMLWYSVLHSIYIHISGRLLQIFGMSNSKLVLHYALYLGGINDKWDCIPNQMWYVIHPILAVPFHIRLYVLVGQDDSMVPVDLMTYNGKEDDSALSTATIPSS